MKLESIDRRDFLKYASAAIAPGTFTPIAGAKQLANVSKFARQIAAYKSSGIDFGIINDILFNVVNDDYGDGSTSTKLPKYKCYSNGDESIDRDVVIGALASNMEDDPTDVFLNYTGDNPERLNGFDNVLAYYKNKLLNQLGPQNFLRALFTKFQGQHIEEIDDEVWHAIRIIVPNTQELSQLFQGCNLDDPISIANKLTDIKAIKPSEAKRIIKNEELKRDYYQNKPESKPESEYSEDPEQLETYNIPHDYNLASSMHQPFESKLAMVLNTIY